jgi:pyruvate dehydrogenase E2 component (dihydrolipoamide acetyltransferase)
MEFRSFDRGVLLKILADAGAIVKLGQPVAIIGQQGDDISELLNELDHARSGPEAAAAPSAKDAGSPQLAQQSTPPEPPPVPPALGATGRIKASPYVRKMAREQDLDLTLITGSGPGGRIVARDLQGSSHSTAISAPSDRGGSLVRTTSPAAVHDAHENREPEVRPLSMMRRTIAKRLVQAKQTIPHFYLTMDVDASKLVSLRRQLNSDLATMPEPAKLSYNDLIIKATAVALRRFPAVNAQYTEDAIIYHRRVDISVAVALEDGLVTPVVRNADLKSPLAIATEVRELAARARSRQLSTEEMTGGTFSISNLGMYGIEHFAAVINPPEGAILAVGAIRDEAVVQNGSLAPGKKLKLTLSCDHRVIDGATGAEFLAGLRSVLENPSQIVLF